MGDGLSSREDRRFGPEAVAGVDYLLSAGNVRVGKDRGQGSLLLTGKSLFVFRTRNQGMITGAAVGGIAGALIGAAVDRKRAKNAPSAHRTDPEIMRLGPKVMKRLEADTLLAKLPVDTRLKVKRTVMGMKFSDGTGREVAYQGLFHKSKIARFLGERGIEAS